MIVVDLVSPSNKEGDRVPLGGFNWTNLDIEKRQGFIARAGTDAVKFIFNSPPEIGVLLESSGFITRNRFKRVGVDEPEMIISELSVQLLRDIQNQRDGIIFTALDPQSLQWAGQPIKVPIRVEVYQSFLGKNFLEEF